MLLITAIGALAACGDSAATFASPCATTECAAPQGPPAELVAYLDHALDLMQQYSINKKRIDWPAFRAEVHQKSIAAHTLGDMRLGITYALEKLGDKHSYLAPPIAMRRSHWRCTIRFPTTLPRSPRATGS